MVEWFVDREWEYTHASISGSNAWWSESNAWWLLTLPRKSPIWEIRVYNRFGDRVKTGEPRINGVGIWVGTGLSGGSYEGALKVGTIKYVENKNPYIFSELDISGSSVEVQGHGTGNQAFLILAEVEVYFTSSPGKCGQNDAK